MAEIRLLLVDDHAILLEGLRALLRYYPDIEVVGMARNGAEALEAVARVQPDVVLMDIAMPEMNGIVATRLLKEKFPQVKVLILSQYDDKEYVLPLIRVGAAGYILKNSVGVDLINALHTVASGELYLSPSVSKVLVDEFRFTLPEETQTPEALTPRESEILRYIVAGKTNAQIALALSISANTVIWHRANLMSKLGVHSAAELVSYAWQHGLVNDDSPGFVYQVD